jgi:UDPglucose 6-dehydrogenase
MRISVIGAGYVGLVQTAIMANIGHDVMCVDSDPEKIKKLKNGECPIYEPELQDMIEDAKAQIFYGNTVEQAANWGEIVFVCVGTPEKEDGSPDLQYIDNVAKEIGESMREHIIVVNKSTVPPGTAHRVKEIIQKYQKFPTTFDVVSNPEFLREGCAIHDAMNGDRIVIGTDNWKTAEKLIEAYQELQTQVFLTDTISAEMIKYASNAFLATKISFINAIAQICEQVGADVKEVARGMGLDHRIGDKFLGAGIGWGGSCFGKDTSALIHIADQIGYDFKMLKATKEINEQMPKEFIQKIQTNLNGVNDKIIGVLGVAFKPDTDDMRDARSIPIIQKLVKEGAIVKVYDPVAKHNAEKILTNVQWTNTIEELAENTDAILIITEWKEFKDIKWREIKQKMRNPRIFDGRNMFE